MSDLPEAGWYPDPEDASQQRYWDGAQWTDHRAPAAPPAPPAATSAPAAPPPPAWGGHQVGAQAAGPAPTPGWGAQPQGGQPTAAQKTSGLAVAALVLSLIWLGGFGSVLAIVLGLVALSQIKKSQGQQGGRGFAIAGVIIGVLGTLATAAMIALLIAASNASGGIDEFFDCLEREIETGQDLNC